MLTDLKIVELVENAVKAINKAKGNTLGKGKGKLPEFNEIYLESVKMQDHIAIHAKNNDFPEALFFKIAPNQTDAEREWQKLNYKPLTKSVYRRGKSITNRIWNRQNYSVTFEDETQREYFAESYPEFGSLIKFFEQVLTSEKVDDANAIAVICPDEIPYKSEPNEEGYIETDPTQEIEPIVKIYDSKHVIAFESDEYAMVELFKKCKYKVSGVEQEGIIFEIYDDTNIYRITQIGELSKYKGTKSLDKIFSFELYYTHGLGKLPCLKLKGIPIMTAGEVLYKSFVWDAIPVLDIVLVDNSVLQQIKAKGGYPQHWRIADPCNAEGCHNGLVRNYKNEEDQVGYEGKCSICGGTGSAPRSPFNEFEVKIPKRLDGDTPVITPPFGSLEISQYAIPQMRTEIKENISNFFDMLNIDLKPNGSGNVTATEVIEDRQDMHSFLLLFASETFHILKESIECIGRMRFGDKFKNPVIKPPVNFSIRTESDLTDELKVANETNLTPQYKIAINGEALAVRFPNDPRQQTVFEIVAYCDGIFLASATDINLGLANGSIKPIENILHRYIYEFIADKDESFFSLDQKSQRTKLMEDAKARLEELNPSNIELPLV